MMNVNGYIGYRYPYTVYTNCLKRICTRSKLLMNIKKISQMTNIEALN